MTHAALMAGLSAAVYMDWPKARLRAAELGMPVVDTVSHNDVEAMFCMGSTGPRHGPIRDSAAIAFRGTQFTSLHYRDIANNFGRPVLWAGPGRAHSGYATQLERLRDRAADWFEDVPSHVPLYITGHSLGGSVAGLFAAWAVGARGGNIAGLYTFGAPKAATREAWAWLWFAGHVPRIEVYQMKADFAPWWPPSFSLTQPAKPIKLKSPDDWTGPLRRHDVDRYERAIRLLAA